MGEVLPSAEQKFKTWAESLKEGYAELRANEPVKVPCIIYSSRTHSQLAQVMKELKSTSYK